MIGNIEEASFILRHVRSYQGGNQWTYATPGAPDGWEKLGEGCYRVTYLSPSGVAYKVQLHRDSYQSNEGEFRNIRKQYLTKLPKGCRLPRVGLFKAEEEYVIAMEYFENLLRDFGYYTAEGSRYHDALHRLQYAVPISDMHGSNVAVDVENDQIIPIDWGA